MTRKSAVLVDYPHHRGPRLCSDSIRGQAGGPELDRFWYKLPIAIVPLLLGSLPIVDLSAQPYEIQLFREAFYQAAQSQKAAHNFQDRMTSFSDSTDAMILGYKGAARFMLAYHGSNPLTKLEHFREGKRLLGQAIESYPEVIELRFLRYAVQTSAPRFLGHTQDIRKDQDLMLAALYAKELTDKDLESRMVEFMLRSKYCNTKDKKKLLEIRKTLNPVEK